MHFAPIVVQDGERRLVRLARYHCRQAGKPASIDRKFPGLYNARRDNLEKFWRHEFGYNHAVMLAESFYENVDRNGRNAVLHFVPRPADTMLVACLFAQWTDPAGGEPLLSFAAVTDEPPPEVAAAGHDRMIVNLKPEHVAAWLTPAGRSLQELQDILSGSTGSLLRARGARGLRRRTYRPFDDDPSSYTPEVRIGGLDIAVPKADDLGEQSTRSGRSQC